jgi:hypothetical protein
LLAASARDAADSTATMVLLMAGLGAGSETPSMVFSIGRLASAVGNMVPDKPTLDFWPVWGFGLTADLPPVCGVR